MHFILNRNQKYWIVYLCMTLLLIPSILPFMPTHKVTALEETHDWQRVAAGRDHSLAITPDGGVVAWGYNPYGQSTVPEEAKKDIVSVSVGQDHSLALTSTGKVIAWGGGRFNEADIPEEVNDKEIISVMSGPAAFHSLAISSEGEVFAWGDNFYGQSTVHVEAKSNIVAVSAGYRHSLALSSAGEVIAWGANNHGQSTLPAEAKSDIVAISAGAAHSLALTSSGEVIAWGANNYGQSTVPAEAKNDIVAISAGGDHSLALTSSGEVIAWGDNQFGQSTVPAEAKSDIVAISAGYQHALALKKDGTIVAWGVNNILTDIPTLKSIALKDQKGGRKYDIHFDSNKDQYHVLVDHTISTINIRSKLDELEHGVVFVNGEKQTDLSAGVDVELTNDLTNIEVKVSPYFTEDKIYTITVEKAKEPLISFTPNGNENWLQQQTSTKVTVEHADPNEPLWYAWTNSTQHPDEETIWTSFLNGDTIHTPTEDGEWYLHVRALDVAGGEKIESSKHFRLDSTPPELTLLGDNPMNLLYGESFEDPGYEVTDNIDVDIKNKVVVEGEVNTTKVGTYTLTYRVKDAAGNEATVTRTVNVNDEEQPVITLIGDNPLILEVGTPYEEPGAIAEDNADGDISDQIKISGEVDITKLGTYTIRYNVADSSGNQAQEVIRTVEVVDTIPPELTLNGDEEVTLEYGETYEEQGATANDHYDGDVTEQVEIRGNVNPKQVGTYEIVYSVEDSSGNVATIIRTVKVVDTTAPRDVTLSVQETSTHHVTFEFSAYDLSGIKEYRLFRDGLEIARIDGNTSVYTDDDLQSGKTYTYHLIAIDFSGNESEDVNVKVTTERIVSEVESFDEMTVAYGTTIQDIPLPDRVTVFLQNGETIQVPVHWNEGEPTYDKHTVGIYEFTGEIDLPEGVKNPAAKHALVKVIVETPNFIEIVVDERSVLAYAGALVKVKDTNTTLQLPEDLPEGTMLQVTSVKNMATPGLVQAGEIYRFHFTYPDGYEDYTGDFVLTMGSYEDAENVAIYHNNEEAEDWEYVGGETKGNTVTSTVNEFSTYGVFTEEIAENEQVPIDQPEIEDSDERIVNKDDKHNKVLPKTATTIYSWLLVGSLFILLAIFTWRVNRKRKRVD